MQGLSGRTQEGSRRFGQGKWSDAVLLVCDSVLDRILGGACWRDTGCSEGLGSRYSQDGAVGGGGEVPAL